MENFLCEYLAKEDQDNHEECIKQISNTLKRVSADFKG